MKYLTEQQKMQLEETHKLVESEYFKDVLYCVDRNGKGIHILYGQGHMKEMKLTAADVKIFVEELWGIWQLHR